MKLSQLEYDLPKELIAHSPASPRDSSRLLVVDRTNGEIDHKYFSDLPEVLTPNDVLVFNQTKVFPARLYTKTTQGKKVEILLLRQVSMCVWTAMHKGKLKVGDLLTFSEVSATVIKKVNYEVTLKFTKEISEIINKYGQTPLPPYINSLEKENVKREKYQTTFAKENGSVAAPTAGLHFTQELIEKIKSKGTQIEYVTLHVGAGTFLPIKEDDITKHKMHSEYFTLTTETSTRLNEAKSQGKRIIAVGTTTARVLESCATNQSSLTPNNASTDIFIYPPYKFKFVDALITNFHLPHSTLLALVSAFVSKPNTENEFSTFLESIAGKAYTEAIKNLYRFYSFGDGMLIN